LVRIDPLDEEIRQSSPTLDMLSSVGARVTVITEEPERTIDCDIIAISMGRTSQKLLSRSRHPVLVVERTRGKDDLLKAG
jgi:hypothetical protein